MGDPSDYREMSGYLRTKTPSDIDEWNNSNDLRTLTGTSCNDTERIQLLLEENKLLKSRLNEQEKLIDVLKCQLEANGIPILSNSVIEEDKNDVPMRSERRIKTTSPKKQSDPKTSDAKAISDLGGNSNSISNVANIETPIEVGSTRSSVYSEIQDAFLNETSKMTSSSRNSVHSGQIKDNWDNEHDKRRPSVTEEIHNSDVQQPGYLTRFEKLSKGENLKLNDVVESSSENNKSRRTSRDIRINLPVSSSPKEDPKQGKKNPHNSSFNELTDQMGHDSNFKPDNMLSKTSSQLSENSVSNQSHRYMSNYIHKPYETSVDSSVNLFRSNPSSDRIPNSRTFGNVSAFNTSDSSFSATKEAPFIHVPDKENHPALLIEPKDVHTITFGVVSTIAATMSSPSKKGDEATCVLAINDKKTGKEMWRIRKKYEKLMRFDHELRGIFDFFGLPNLPDKHMFTSNTPSKVDARITMLQAYFSSIFFMPHIPQSVLFLIAQFVSDDFINPLDDFKSGAMKEGFLIKRYKGLGTSWKVRWCQVDGPYMEIFDYPGGNCIEEIKLDSCQIGKQGSDSVAEDKGYRHAFLILETSQRKLSTSVNRHFFCAESDFDRDEWITTLCQFVKSEPISQTVQMEQKFDEDKSSKLINSFPTNSTEISNSSELADSKELKKQKKKSLFPFRAKFNTSVESDINEPSSLIVDGSPKLKGSHFTSEADVQSYLNKMNLDDSINKDIFGKDIDVSYEYSHNKLFDKEIPSICFRCIDFLLKRGSVYEEGIFRLSGSASTIRQLKDEFNTNHDLNLFETPLNPDIHTVAGLLKGYLRETPSPILGGKQYEDLRNIVVSNAHKGSGSALALQFRDYLKNPNNIDDIHYNTSYVIFRFLTLIISNSSVNKMNLKNMCIVFVPTLKISLEVLETFFVDFKCIFEGGNPLPDAQRVKLDLFIPNF